MELALTPFVSDMPAVTYRRALSVDDRLTANEFKPTRGDACKTLGTFSCGGCTYCDYTDAKTSK